jgi:hypothetical protein
MGAPDLVYFRPRLATPPGGVVVGLDISDDTDGV